MSAILIDDFSAAVPWVAVDAANVPSVELAHATDVLHRGYLPDAASLRIDATALATGHRVERAIPALDLDVYAELRLWYRCTSRSDGSEAHPFRLRVELGSAALPIDAVGNDWHRYLHADAPNAWQFVRLALDDLAPAVRSAVSQLRLTYVAAAGSVSMWLDDLVSARAELIADVDAALLLLLDGQLVLGAPVPARVHVPGAVAPAVPWLRLVHYDVRHAGRRATGLRPRSDYTDDGYRVRSESEPYDLFYRIEPVATDAPTQAALLQFVIDVLRHRRDLLVAAVPHALESIPRPIQETEVVVTPALYYRVAAYGEPASFGLVRGARTIRTTEDVLN